MHSHLYASGLERILYKVNEVCKRSMKENKTSKPHSEKGNFDAVCLNLYLDRPFREPDLAPAVVSTAEPVRLQLKWKQLGRSNFHEFSSVFILRILQKRIDHKLCMVVPWCPTPRRAPTAPTGWVLGVLGTTKVEAKPKARPFAMGFPSRFRFTMAHEKDHVKRMTYHVHCDIIRKP